MDIAPTQPWFRHFPKEVQHILTSPDWRPFLEAFIVYHDAGKFPPTLPSVEKRGDVTITTRYWGWGGKG